MRVEIMQAPPPELNLRFAEDDPAAPATVLRSNVPRRNPTARPDLRPPSNRKRAMGPFVAAGAAMAPPMVATRLAAMLPETAPAHFRFAALAAACWQASVRPQALARPWFVSGRPWASQRSVPPPT